jgi:hypothetical protein
VLQLSKADACIVIAQRDAAVNIRWANNTITTSGVMERTWLSVVSIVDRRVASVTRTHFPPDQLEAMVRESEAACQGRPVAPDYMPLLADATKAKGWGSPLVPADIHVMDYFRP